MSMLMVLIFWDVDTDMAIQAYIITDVSIFGMIYRCIGLCYSLFSNGFDN
jgi:hypothetical protein